MNNLIIRNEGFIEVEDLTLIGSSTKRGDTDKIGMFGSGWKYALAWLVRNNVNIQIYRGTEPILIDFELVKHRNSDVPVITVAGTKTSLTSEMGPQWTGWMAIREILSNAIDEGNHEIFTNFQQEEGNHGIKLKDNTTTVIIPMIKELSQVMREYDNYFAFEREENYTDVSGNRYFIKKDESSAIYYRKGIRCMERANNSYVDIDFKDISINESRLTDNYAIRNKIRYAISNKEMPLPVLIKCLEGEKQNLPNFNANIHETCKELLDLGYHITTSFMLVIESMTQSSMESVGIDKGTLIVPADWYNQLIKKGTIKKAENMLLVDGLPIDATKTTGEHNETLQKHLSTFNLQDKPLVPCTWEESCKAYYVDGFIYYKVPTDNHGNYFVEVVEHLMYGISRQQLQGLIINYVT
tara:strand:- start:54636 stop:55868 length:1233 start_codon:yes stop_codon:yes gene_type:complete